MLRSFDAQENGGVWNDVVKFSPELNTVILSRSHLKAPYFDAKYPVAVDFARIGRDFADTLLNALEVFNREYLKQPRIAKRNVTLPSNGSPNLRYIPYGNDIIGESLRCVMRQVHLRDQQLPDSIEKDVYHRIRVARLTARTYASFVRLISENRRVSAPELDDTISYEALGLRQQQRQPGLRQLDGQQLFGLAYMQDYCAVIGKNYEKIKPYTENEVPRHEM